jgi:transposase
VERPALRLLFLSPSQFYSPANVFSDQYLEAHRRVILYPERLTNNRLNFMEHYHMRSNVESAFSMIKGKFGDSVRSKSDTGQVNEALCKVLCHNICCLVQALHELGIEPTFGSGGPFDSESELEPKLFA